MCLFVYLFVQPSSYFCQKMASYSLKGEDEDKDDNDDYHDYNKHKHNHNQ